MAKLGEVCLLKAGKFVSANDISPEYNKGLYLDMVEQQTGRVVEYNFVGEDGLNGSITQFDTENVLYSKLRPNLNKVVLPERNGFCTSELLPLRPDARKLDRSYLAVFLRSDGFVNWAVSKTAGAKMPRLGTKDLLNANIPLPEIKEQKAIAEKFEKLEELIFLRKQQIAKLDELVKARFVEMFGNPIRNDKHFVQKTGKSLFCFSSGKFLQEEKRFQHGFPVYGGNGITWYTDIPLVKKPTIIIGRVGAYCGNVRMVNVPVWITDNAIYIKEFKTRELNLHFLLMLMKYMKFSNYADYSGQPKITQKPLETLIYIVPPLELQNRFAAFVERVDQQKQTVQQSLEKLELMKKALMQEYFG